MPLRHGGRLLLFSILATLTAREARTQQLSPVDFWRMRQRADSLFAAREMAPAESLYRVLAPADSTDVQLWRNLAQAELANGKAGEARAILIRTFPEGPYPQDVALFIAELWAGEGNKAAALDWLDTALAHRFAARSQLLDDSAFASYHDDARFRRIAGLLPKRKFTRNEGWRYDLAYYVSEAKRLHTDPGRPAYSAEMTKAAAELDRRIPTLSDDQILAGLQHISVILADGHTAVYRRLLPKGRTRLPVDFYWFTEGMYIVGARDDMKSLVGSKVIRIGTLTPEAAVRALAPYVPRDNPEGLISVGVPYLLTLPFQLQAIGAVSDPSAVALTLEARDGHRQDVVLKGDDAREPIFRLMPLAGADSVPLWLTHVADNYWMTPLPDAHAVYFQYNAVANMPNENTTKFAERLKEALRQPGIENLIVDVRRNGGGNSFLNPPLHLAMIDFEQSSPDHHIYMLIGRTTFSAAQNFTNYVERWTHALMVGEPTGSRPNFVGEGNQIVLPYSGIVANISNRNHQSAFWEDTRIWVAPTVPVPVTAADFFGNRDAGLNAVKAIIGTGGKGKGAE